MAEVALHAAQELWQASHDLMPGSAEADAGIRFDPASRSSSRGPPFPAACIDFYAGRAGPDWTQYRLGR